MDKKLKEVQYILKKYDQNHLLYFFDKLSCKEKELLLNDIINLNFEKILTLYNNSKKPSSKNYTISPLKYYIKENLSNTLINKYTQIGEQVIKNNSFAVVTMAGGQGSRLGHNGPKGCYEIKFDFGKKSLFEILCENITKANKLYNIVIPWYIMVSEENQEQTINFFKEHNYFSYPKDYIKFFVQDTIPLLDVNGKIILQDYYKIKKVSNGNGNVFKSMNKYKIIEEMKQKNIQWVHFSGVDNILMEHVDPLFLGMTVFYKKLLASKTAFKEDPLDDNGVFCKKDSKISIIYGEEINLELSNLQDKSGNFLYRETNILSHLMHISAIELVSKHELPYHRAYKKNPIINEEGTKIVPTSPNSFKFENFIFDAFSYFDDMLLLRINPEKEFAPIKAFTGLYTPETAKEKYEKIFKK